jgi:hypothetical protein
MKDIKGYEGLYSITRNGEVYSHISNKYLKPMKVLGYLRVELTKNRERKTLRIHRLVAMMFIRNPKNKKEVNHINGIKTDNRVENLEWNTAKENMRHAYDNGLKVPNMICGERHGNSKLKEKDVIKIRKLLKRGLSQVKIGKLYNVSKSAIGDIKRRNTWEHVKHGE